LEVVMQQGMRRFAFFLSGAFLVTGGFLAAACGTDNGTSNTPLPTPEAGRDTGGNPNPDEDGGVEPEDDASTGADCGNAPRLRTNTTTFYCPFRQGDGGPYCASDETCCNPGRPAAGANFPPSYCADGKGDGTPQGVLDHCKAEAAENGSEWPEPGAPVLPGRGWECADKNSCGDNQVCCLFTGPEVEGTDKVNIGPHQSQTIPKECNALQAFKAGGTVCKPAGEGCGAGMGVDFQIKLCSLSDDNCGGGTTCTPFQANFRDLGYCR
jgi:hypothetical protein